MIVDVVLGSMRRARARIERDALACAKYDDRGVFLSGRRAELEALIAMGAREASLGLIYEAHFGAALLIALYGNAEQREQAHRDVEAGELFALWRVRDEEGVRIERRRSTSVLSGTMTSACGADTATRALITARRHDGTLQLCLIPFDRCHATIDDSGCQPLGLEASNSYRVCFDEIELLESDLVGSPGDYERDPWLLGGYLRCAAVQTGVLERLTRETLDYLVARGHDRDPYQRARAGELRVAAHTARNWLRAGEEAWNEFDAAPTQRAAEDVTDVVDMARAAIERAGHHAIGLVGRSVGAAGMLQPLPFSQLVRDLQMYLCDSSIDAAVARTGETGLRRSASVYSIAMGESLRASR